MNKKATPPLPEKPTAGQLDTGGLTEKTRDKYLLALNELVGTLSIKHSKRVDVADFCKRHDLKESFFDALRDLEALMLDHLKSEIDEPFYQATQKLVEVTPAQVVGQMKASGRADRTRKIETDRWESISNSGLVQQPPPPANEVISEHDTAAILSCEPMDETLPDLRELIKQQDFAALDYLAEHLSVIANKEFDYELFYKQFPAQVDLIRFLIQEGMLIESDEGKYPTCRITVKLMAAIHQKTLHPILPAVEPKTTEAADQTTPADDKLKCLHADCSTSVCSFCADDSEKRVHLMSKSARPDPFDEDELQRRYKQDQDRRQQDGEVYSRGNHYQFAPQSQPEMISRGADFAVLPLQHPYNIDIEAHGLRLNMNVHTTEDADIIDAITFKLKRRTLTTA